MLVEGFERLPVVLMNWTHPYYPGLLEGAGLVKAMDTLMWTLNVTDRDQVHPAIFEMAAKVESEHGIICRPMRKSDIEAEVGRFLEVYNEAWQRNWGFVPLTEVEVRHYAKQLKPLLDENWAMIAETADGRVAGAALSLPDYNQVFRHMKGRLLPIGWLKFLIGRRKIDRVRVFALGVKKEYQHTGIAAKFYEMHYDSAERTPQKRRRDGLDPRDQQADEPRHGGHGRRGRLPLPHLRARLRRTRQPPPPGRSAVATLEAPWRLGLGLGDDPDCAAARPAPLPAHFAR